MASNIWITSSEMETFRTRPWDWYVTYYLKKGHPRADDPYRHRDSITVGSAVAQGSRFHEVAVAAFTHGFRTAHEVFDEIYNDLYTQTYFRDDFEQMKKVQLERNWCKQRLSELFTWGDSDDDWSGIDLEDYGLNPQIGECTGEAVVTYPDFFVYDGSSYGLACKIDVLRGRSFIDFKTTGNISASLRQGNILGRQMMTYCAIVSQKNMVENQDLIIPSIRYSLMYVNKEKVTERSPAIAAIGGQYDMVMDEAVRQLLRNEVAGIHAARRKLDAGWAFTRVLPPWRGTVWKTESVDTGNIQMLLSSSAPNDLMLHILQDYDYTDVDPLGRYEGALS